MTKNRKDNLKTYAEISITLLAVSSLLCMGFSLYMSISKALLYTIIIDCIIIPCAISLFNYLQYDTFNFFVKEDLYNNYNSYEKLG